MKKRPIRNRVKYWVDRMMSKGPISMIVLLFAITIIIVAIIGIIAALISDTGGVLYQMWISLMNALDPGSLAGVPMDNAAYLFLMFLATLCGLFLTSLLIGIIATGVEGRLGNLRKGTSVVQENGHTVIIGFDNNVYAILQELIVANYNKKNAYVVVLGEQSKEEMEDAVSAHIKDTATTKIIFRSGKLHENYALERCSIETCNSVIVNVYDDIEIIKILLALSTYLKDKELFRPDLKFIVSLQDMQYMEAANIAGEGRAEIIYAKDAIARIISNTCRQHGLSQIWTELFNFSGNELYFEKVPELTGKSVKEALLSFSNAVVVGLYTSGQVVVNPPMDTVIQNEDKVILLEEDDGAYKVHPAKTVDESKICNHAGSAASANNHLIILGSNDKISIILAEYNKYVKPETKVIIVDNDLDKNGLDAYENLDITVCDKKITRDVLCEIANKGAKNILLLNDDSIEPEDADSQTLLRLILLRDIADGTNMNFAITTEMQSVDNQRLAKQARVDDFVIGSNFVSLIMAQLSENPYLMPVFDELLDESGSEMYMKPVADYVPIGVPVDSYALTESAALKGEIYLGYRYKDGIENNVVVNPDKEDTIIFGERDQIVVIAEN